MNFSKTDICLPSGGSLVAETVKRLYNVGDPGSIPGWEDPLEEEMATLSSILAWEVPWTESLAGYSSWACRDRHDVATKHQHNHMLH